MICNNIFKVIRVFLPLVFDNDKCNDDSRNHTHHYTYDCNYNSNNDRGCLTAILFLLRLITICSLNTIVIIIVNNTQSSCLQFKM